MRARRAYIGARLLLGACVAVATALAGCFRKDTPAKDEPSPKILRVSQRNEPATLDVHLATLPDEFFILRAITEGLVTPNPSGGTPLPGVAERWETSADGRTWTFRLRADAKWSNGDDVTASDFIFSYRRALTPAVGAPKARLFYVIKNAGRFHRGEISDFRDVGLSAPDHRTLVIKLEAPTPHLLALAASGPWLPVHPPTLEKQGAATTRAAGWTNAGIFVGNGPFQLTEWKPDQHLLVQRNPRYWQAARVLVDAVRFQIYDSGDTEERAFRAGQVDITMAVPFAKLPSYPEAQRRQQRLFETRYLALNTRRAPLDDINVRLALSSSLDREALVTNVTRGGQDAAYSFIPPGLGGYQPLADADSQPAAATTGKSTTAMSSVRPLEFSAWGVSPVALEALQQMWLSKLGVRADIVQREGRVHLAALAVGDFDVAFTPAIPDFDDPLALLGELVTGAPGNYSQWSNPEFDLAVKEAAQTTDASRRMEFYRKAEQILLNELPIIPVYFNTQNYLVSPRVRGWRQDPLWNRFYLDVSIE